MTTKEQYAAWKAKKIAEDFNGDEEAYNTWRRNNSSKGGKNTPKEKRSFSRDKNLAIRAGSLGGKAKKINVKKSRDKGYIIGVSTPTSRKVEAEAERTK